MFRQGVTWGTVLHMAYRRRARRFASTDWERLGRAVKRERALQGWSQAQLAKAAKVSNDVIERLERTPHSGSEILATNLYKIENALDWPAGEAERVLMDRSSYIPTNHEASRRSRVIETLHGIRGVGVQEIEAMVMAFDRETGNRTS